MLATLLQPTKRTYNGWGTDWKRMQDRQQELAYEAAMGRKWDKPWSEQFDYTGHRRKLGNGQWESRGEQIARLTGFTIEQLELVAA